MASRTIRAYNLDYEVAGEIDRRAPPGDRSDLVNQLLMEALQARRRNVAEGMVHAGIGTAALTALMVLATILLA